MVENRFPVFLFCLFIAWQNPVLAQDMSLSDAMEQGTSFGSDHQADLSGLSTNQSADTVPGYQGTNLPETQYSDNPMAMEDDARQQMNDSESGSFVSESAVNRPQFEFDQETDPLLTRADSIQGDPESVSGRIEATFSGCQSSTLTTPAEYSKEVCTEWRESELLACTETLQLTCDRPVECDAGDGDGDGENENGAKFRASPYCDCEWSERWENTCGALESEWANGICAQPTRICSQPTETRTIANIDVYRDCWAYEKTYECAAPSTTEEDYCGVLRDRGCSQIGSQCNGNLNNGLCESYEQTYQCEISPGTATEIMDCGGQTMCMAVGCFDTSYEPSQDFGAAASALGALSEAGEDFDVDTNEIFKGDDLRCSKAVLGFSNCCKIDGWGQEAGLDQCDSNEQRLALSRKGGLCHYVGSYCSNKTLFGCTSRKETHCCFKSKLARIIHEQGRIQLGLDWGSAKTPNCDGITIEQLQSLDFSQIDFSEFYTDAMDKASSPSGGELQGIIQNYIEQSYQ